jgi:hypothetical protein
MAKIRRRKSKGRVVQAIHGSCKMPGIAGKPSTHRLKVKKQAKAPKAPNHLATDKVKFAGADGATAKYFSRAQKWRVFFATGQAASKAVDAINKLNKERQCLLFGTDIQRNGKTLEFTWHSNVAGKTLYNYFRLHAAKTLGPGGSAPISDYRPTGPAQSCQLEGDTSAIGEENSANKAQHVGYPALPTKLASVSFDCCRCWNLEQVKAGIEEQGFACIRGFTPKLMTDQAFQEATKYFLGVLKSFEHGYAIDEGLPGIDKLQNLPSKVWENKPKAKQVKHFVPGPWGMDIAPQTNEVMFVETGGQAAKMGVEAGWVVVGCEKVDSKAVEAGKRLCKRRVDGQPLAALLASDLAEGGDVVITFQPPMCYSPLAITQKWGVMTTRGHQHKLGLGKCTDPVNFQDAPAVMSTQLWMRNFISCLHGCLPEELCWQPDGVSFKARHAPSQTHPKT